MKTKVKQDGGSTNYYVIPPSMKTINDLINHKKMTAQVGFIFETCYILGDVKPNMVHPYLQSMLEAIEQIISGKDTKNFVPSKNYILPSHATELRHLISHKAMSKSRGDIFKACYRLGEKEGFDESYDLNKIKFFIHDLLEMYDRKEHI